MADLIVTAEVLEDAARQLAFIQEEFEHSSRDRDERGDIWGHDVLTSAMSDFAEDWLTKRVELAEALKGLREKLDEAAQAWSEAEDQLTRSLDSQGDGPPALRGAD